MEGVERVVFLGVSTAGSRIHAVMPAWARTLGRPIVIEGIDLPLDASREDYRAMVARLRDDPGARGAVITSHKLAVYAAARDLLASTDAHAALLHEVNALAVRDGRVSGHARDPLAVDRVLPGVLGERWAPGASDVVCLGAGGAGSALALSLLYRADGPRLVPREDGPRRATFVDVRADRLEALRALLEAMPRPAGALRYAVHEDPRANDRLIAGLLPGSLVVNATGLGKERPGSPLSPAAAFPEGATAWDLNYRGPLEFLEQARDQAPSRDLRVQDGWAYFLHGWTQALSPVLDLDMTPACFASLAEAAAPLRPEGPPTARPAPRR